MKLSIIFSCFMIFFLTYGLILAFLFLKKNSKDSGIAFSTLFAAKSIQDHYKKINVGINIPAYNEENVILETIYNVLSLNYKFGDKEIIVVSDGSTDSTERRIISEFRLSEQEYCIPYDFKVTEKVKNLQ